MLIPAILTLALAANLQAQTSVTTDVIPIKGRPALVQASYTPAGTVALQAVTLPSGYTIVQAGGNLFVQAPPGALEPTQNGWITLGQSAVDPLIWCVTDNPLTFKYYAAMIHTWITTTTTGQLASVYFRDEFGDIQLGPQQGQGSTSTLPPQWSKSHPSCGGNPGVIFPSTALNPGEARTAVQVRVVF